MKKFKDCTYEELKQSGYINLASGRYENFINIGGESMILGSPEVTRNSKRYFVDGIEVAYFNTFGRKPIIRLLNPNILEVELEIMKKRDEFFMKRRKEQNEPKQALMLSSVPIQDLVKVKPTGSHFVLRLYRGYHWGVGDLYLFEDGNLKDHWGVNRFYEIDEGAKYFCIYEATGGSGIGFKKGALKHRIYIGNSSFTTIEVG